MKSYYKIPLSVIVCLIACKSSALYAFKKQADYYELLDSFRTELSEKKGIDKITVLTKLAWFSYRCSDFDELEKECIKQGERQALALAYAAKVKTVQHIYPKSDSTIILANQVLPILNSIETINEYAAIKAILVEHFLSTNRIQEAQKEVIEMQEEEALRSHFMIRAMIYYAQGRIFYAIQDFDSSASFFTRAINEINSSEELIPQRALFELSCWLADTNIKRQEYNDATYSLQRARKVLEDMDRTNRTDFTNCYPIRYNALLAEVAVKRNNIEEAQKKIKICESLMISRIPSRLYSDYYFASYELHKIKGEYSLALADLNICLFNVEGSSAYYFNLLKQKAELLLEMGRYTESVEILERYIRANDSIYQKEISEQAARVREEYRVNDITRERNYILWVLASCLASCWIIFFLIIRYIRTNRFLSHKNEVLLHNLEQLDHLSNERKLHDKEVCHKENIVEPEEEDLYNRIESYLTEENRFTNFSVSRDTIASAMNTNRTYVANAIKKCTNLTVSEYINLLRLEYSRKLLLKSPEMSLLQVAEKIGFGTVRNYRRLFFEKYGMFPSEYREQKPTNEDSNAPQ